ncbi:hypothetical protein HOY34_18040 [Xinfangfangia sp. D13-10-4-6]|uniref:hypothetical protein n=1 Tax=Pseudogemmobacter hezensis TaxID=2737662 RepID=UPI001553838C|nr:hypothetical protein [Pseudogemmobacter hezensis]NPD17097.1 hypothetical protein [Pseudogemmobacter hezensis]
MFYKFRATHTEASEKKLERRWLKSVIAASGEPLPAFPWMRGAKDGQSPRRPIEIMTAESSHRTTALFRRGSGPNGLAAR